jgi:hypothetical protein
VICLIFSHELNKCSFALKLHLFGRPTWTLIYRVQIPNGEGITSRKRPLSMEQRIRELNQYLIGWGGYFSLADTLSVFQALDEWIRRRLRMCLWKQWKQPKTKVKRLLSLGVSKDKAFEWGNTRRGIGVLLVVGFYIVLWIFNTGNPMV